MCVGMYVGMYVGVATGTRDLVCTPPLPREVLHAAHRLHGRLRGIAGRRLAVRRHARLHGVELPRGAPPKAPRVT